MIEVRSVSVLVLILAVSAACCLGFGFVLQQNAAQRAPLSDFLSPRLLLDLIRVPRWLGGLGLMIVGMVLGAVALGRGEISLVEPLLATNLYQSVGHGAPYVASGAILAVLFVLTLLMRPKVQPQATPTA